MCGPCGQLGSWGQAWSDGAGGRIGKLGQLGGWALRGLGAGAGRAQAVRSDIMALV